MTTRSDFGTSFPNSNDSSPCANLGIQQPPVNRNDKIKVIEHRLRPVLSSLCDIARDLSSGTATQSCQLPAHRPHARWPTRNTSMTYQFRYDTVSSRFGCIVEEHWSLGGMSVMNPSHSDLDSSRNSGNRQQPLVAVTDGFLSTFVRGVFPLLVCVSLSLGFQVPLFYNWSGTQQSDAPPIVGYAFAGFLIACCVSLLVLPLLPELKREAPVCSPLIRPPRFVIAVIIPGMMIVGLVSYRDAIMFIIGATSFIYPLLCAVQLGMTSRLLRWRIVCPQAGFLTWFIRLSAIPRRSARSVVFAVPRPIYRSATGFCDVERRGRRWPGSAIGVMDHSTRSTPSHRVSGSASGCLRHHVVWLPRAAASLIAALLVEGDWRGQKRQKTKTRRQKRGQAPRTEPAPVFGGHQPRIAASIAAMSIFCICIIASNARLATAGSGFVTARVRTSGEICHDTPHLSLHQPHMLSTPPLLTMAFQ
jgi:hypothetical protein